MAHAYYAKKKPKKCAKCLKIVETAKYIRKCPDCNIEIKYTIKGNCQQAEKMGKLCHSCSSKHNNFSGENNPFYGKKHTKETKEKISEYAKNKKCTDKQKDALKAGSNKKSFYECWVKKYGVEEAEKRLLEFRKKQSENSSGKNNPMFGKPSPQGSGNGWSGWYNGWYFRSLRELSFMINVIEISNLNWKTTETKEFSISYIDYDGRERNYFPDFLIEDTYIIECKPEKLMQTNINKRKAQAAKRFCLENGYEYIIVEPIILNNEKILELYTSGKLRFVDRYEKKFQERYLK